MLRFLFLACVCLLTASAAFAETPEFVLQGRITTDKIAPSIRIVLENPKAGNAEAAGVEADANGNYEIRALREREYRVVAWIDGKRQDRRTVEIVCRTGAVVSKDLHYGKNEPTLILYFPAEDPDVVDVAELQGEYPRDVLKEYERAFQDHINGNLTRAIQRLEAIVERAPKFYGAHARLGLIFQQSGCYADAEEEYLRASELSPRSAQPLLNLASVQIRAADGPGSLETQIARSLLTLRKALEIKPGSALAHCLTGAANVKIGSYPEAEKNFQRSLELDRSASAARLMLANLYLRQENWAGAVENLKTYLDDFPEARDRSIVKLMLADAQRNLPR